MITIIDYGLGNVLAFANLYRRLNLPVSVAKAASELRDVTKLILPGVGAFDHAMNRLNQSGMRQEIERLVLEQGVPVLGICVGMQMLAEASDEGKLPGLGWVQGAVRKFDVASLPHKTCLPHMGWNDVHPLRYEGLFRNLQDNARFYFLHSYYFHCHRQEDALAVADYGTEFCCAVNYNNVYGVQFHPEKSHEFGIALLKNFAEL